MVLEFIESDKLNYLNCCYKSTLKCLGENLKKIHDFSDFYPTRYTVIERLRNHYEKAIIRGVAFPTGFKEAVYEVLNSENLYSEIVVPCHGDLNPLNILFKMNKVTFIDWEKASYDDPFMDIGYLSFLLNLTLSQENVFLEAYFGRPALSNEILKLQKTKQIICLLTATVWFHYSEDKNEIKTSYRERVSFLDSLLFSNHLKKPNDYLKNENYLNPKIAAKNEIKAFAVTFYKLFLEKRSEFDYLNK